MKVDTNIKLTPVEEEVFEIIRAVIRNKSPMTQAFAVGGWSRDKLLNIESNDIDIMVDNISGADFAKMVTNYMGVNDPHVIKENPDKSKHITTAKAYLPMSNGETQEIDFAQARKEVYEENSRIPELEVATPQEDAYRRDLTINTIFYRINDGEIVDYTGQGIRDLITGTIRTPLDPLKTFKDDPLRIFRTLRFAAKYQGDIDPETYAAMKNPELIDDIKKKVSKERIHDEIQKSLKGPNPLTFIQLIKDTGLFQHIMDEALKGTEYEGKMAPLDMEQNNPHHELTVWDHTMEVLKNILDLYPSENTEPEKRVMIILSVIMHDLGKLYYEIHQDKGDRTGYGGHEKESANLAKHIMKYLKFDNSLIDQVAKMARYHMRPHAFTEEGASDETVSGPKAMRKFLRTMGEESLNWVDVFNHALADAMSKSTVVDPAIVEKYRSLEQQLQIALDSMGQTEDQFVPVINGNEIMQALNIKPGPWMSSITDYIKELMDANPNITKEEAIQAIQTQFSNIDQTWEKREKNAGTETETKFSACPKPTFKARTNDINILIEEGRPSQAMSIVRELKDNYGNDEDILRLIASATTRILAKYPKQRDNNVLEYIFAKAEKNVFDYVLGGYTFGLLVMLDTPTTSEEIEKIGKRVQDMSPGTFKYVMDLVGNNIQREDVYKQFRQS